MKKSAKRLFSLISDSSYSKTNPLERYSMKHLRHENWLELGTNLNFKEK
jgi:hypothetical protein